MSGTNELKALILVLDEHRQTFGDGQYSFPMESEARLVLSQFVPAIPRLRREAFQRIKTLFFEGIPWAERRTDVRKATVNYVWSLVYPCWYSVMRSATLRALQNSGNNFRVK